ncbi:MAG: carboxypeptidase regulatory-like domain-containing protein, partial [Actinomycetota bacterium]|nr:carboxypeptidase regulatory-like domain-containing protein [Actinomycetota bacterium]
MRHRFVLVLVFVLTTSLVSALPGGAADGDGSISGVVTEDGTPPIVGAAVDLVDPASGITLASEATDGSGAYSFAGVADGDHLVKFSAGGYATEWFDNQRTINAADLITVSDGTAITDVDAALALGASVSGIVTDEVSGLGIPLVDVFVYDGDDQIVLGAATTDGVGAYLVSELPAGDLKIEFSESSGAHLSEWYDNKPYFESATRVPISAGGSATVDAALATGGWITGSVVDGTTDAALAGIAVTVFDPTGTVTIATESTDVSGTYAINVPAGDYIMSFSGDGLSYGTVWWHGMASQDQATEFTIVSGGIHDADEQMWPLGTISGSVVDSDAVPIEGAEVVVYDWDGSPGMGSQPVFVTDATGAYTATGIPDGDYFVQFAAVGYVVQWFDGAPDMASAAVVTVNPPGATITGVDAALDTPPDPVTNVSVPSVSGVAKVGELLSGDRGSWSGTEPISYAYQWLRCDSGGSSCVAVSGATGLSYLLVSGDAGSRFVFEVEASNVVNSVTERSAATAVIEVADVPPSVPPFKDTVGNIHLSAIEAIRAAGITKG